MALIFMDLDGTSLDGGKPAKGVIESIKKLRENNHIVAIATGRSPAVLYDKHKELGIEYLVLANGSYVAHNEKIIYEKSFPNDVVKRLMEYTDKNHMDLVFEYIDAYVAYRKETKIVDFFSEVFNIEKPKVDNKFYPNRHIYAALVFDHDKIKEMEELFPELVFHLSNDYGYDVNLKGDLKAHGVKKLIEHLNYPLEDTYAIGDSHNDITMLKAVKHGIAMGNALDKVKEVAEYVTTEVNNYGIKNALEHYNLI